MGSDLSKHHETREALTGLAEAVKLLAEYSEYSVHVQQRADRLIRALEQEGPSPQFEIARRALEQEGIERVRTNTDNEWAKAEAVVREAKAAADYETWRDEQLDTLRKLFNQRGLSTEYQSFPDFCREQYEGSDNGKVKV